MTMIMAPAAKPRMRDARMQKVRRVAFDAMGEFEQECMMRGCGRRAKPSPPSPPRCLQVLPDAL